MKDDKLKIIVALLSGIIFSLIFILLAFVLPLHSNGGPESPDVQLQKISQHIQRKFSSPSEHP